MQIYRQRPFLTSEGEAVADRARASLAPVALVGAPRSGTYSVARALHRDGDPAGFVSVRTIVDSPRDLAERIAFELQGDPAIDFVTVYLEGLDRQPRGVQELALAWIDEGIRFRSRSVPVRLAAQTPTDPRSGLRTALPLLASRLATLVLPVHPMEAPREELLTIVTEVSADLVRRLGLGSRWLSPEGARNLADRDWPGDFEALEAALSRILASARGSVVTLEDVLADRAAESPPPPFVRPSPAAPSAAGIAAPAPAAGADPGSGLENVVMELAHELKNPMVTLKTFSGHLDRLIEDPETRVKFVALATEAIDRMDGFLEEILAFSRFGDPRPQALPLAPLLKRALATAKPWGERLSGNGVPPNIVVVVDEEQTEFAFRALVRGLCKRLPPDAPIVYQWVAPGGLRFDSSAALTGIALHNIMGQGNRDELSASLDFFVSKTLIERNRGRLTADRDDAGLHVKMELPVAGGR